MVAGRGRHRPRPARGQTPNNLLTCRVGAARYACGVETPDSGSDLPPDSTEPIRLPHRTVRLLAGFEVILYAAVWLLLAVAAVFVLGGAVSGLVSDVSNRVSAVDIGVTILDRVLLALIVAELVYTVRLVLRTHEVTVEPFLVIGLIAVVRRILIITAQLETLNISGRALTNSLLELGLLSVLTFALAGAISLIRRSSRR